MLTREDDDMIVHAANRGFVWVRYAGSRRPAYLIAWKPHRRGRISKTARVRYISGYEATVKPEDIIMPEGQ